jgi:hypothetical protein
MVGSTVMPLFHGTVEHTRTAGKATYIQTHCTASQITGSSWWEQNKTNFNNWVKKKLIPPKSNTDNLANRHQSVV